MSDLMDFDPLTGLANYWDYDEMTGNAIIKTVQDVEPVLNYTKALANAGGTDQGIKQGMWLYAKIPPIVQLQMRQKGIDINDPNATKRIIQEINENYPHLKCTQKNDSGIAKKLYVPK